MTHTEHQATLSESIFDLASTSMFLLFKTGLLFMVSSAIILLWLAFTAYNTLNQVTH